MEGDKHFRYLTYYIQGREGKGKKATYKRLQRANSMRQPTKVTLPSLLLAQRGKFFSKKAATTLLAFVCETNS